jgi:mRNA degradation ribonuclease J1/J2
MNIKDVLIPNIGDLFNYKRKKLNRYKTIETEKKFLDITGFDDMSVTLLKKRDNLKLGVAIISLIIDKKDWFVFKRPKIEIDGFIDEKHLTSVLEKVEEVVFKSIEKIDLSKEDLLEMELTLNLKRFFRKNYKISPRIFLLIDYI